jgi:holo-[acyl-carrier protein] synthase
VIYSIGIDIVLIPRIIALLQRHEKRFLKRVFTSEEQKQLLAKPAARRAEAVAGKFAAKEAVIKALGKFFDRDVFFTDIAVINDVNGKPSVGLTEKLGKQLADAEILISIAHDGEYAIAEAIITDGDGHAT